MSDLIAVAYPDRATAEKVRGELARLTREHVIEIEDTVVATREQNGRVKLHQTVNPAGTGAAGGALWGGLIGLIFLAPLLGAAIGAAAGAASRAVTDLGIEERVRAAVAGRRWAPARPRLPERLSGHPAARRPPRRRGLPLGRGRAGRACPGSAPRGS